MRIYKHREVTDTRKRVFKSDFSTSFALYNFGNRTIYISGPNGNEMLIAPATEIVVGLETEEKLFARTSDKKSTLIIRRVR